MRASKAETRELLAIADLLRQVSREFRAQATAMQKKGGIPGWTSGMAKRTHAAAIWLKIKAVE